MTVCNRDCLRCIHPDCICDEDTQKEIRAADARDKACRKTRRTQKKIAWQKTYYRANEKKLRQYSSEYYYAHKEQIAAAKRRYYQRHKAERAAYARERRIWNAWQSPDAEKNRAMGDAIRSWRKDMGVTQAELAKSAGISATIISTYETGTSPARAERFRAVPGLYGILQEVEREFDNRAG